MSAEEPGPHAEPAAVEQPADEPARPAPRAVAQGDPAADPAAPPLPAAGDPPAVTDAADDEADDDDAAFLDPDITGEVIEVWDERPDKPFDRDTEVRITGEELTRRGVTSLSQALESIPEINVRYAGRGGRVIDVRGARKGSVKILIDGVPVSDPFYGTFDVSSIPVTDIVQIRVSASPSSPIDGVGGPGGVIEIHTRDAVGKPWLGTRVLSSSLPENYASATARSMLSEHWAIRPSASATLGSHNFTIAQSRVGEDRHDAYGGLRLEYRRGQRRLVTDIVAQHRSFLIPPSEVDGRDIRGVEGESSLRMSVAGDDRLGAWRLQGQVFGHALERDSRSYSSVEELRAGDWRRMEDLEAQRFGARALANRSLRERFQLIGSAVFIRESTEYLSTGMSGAGAVIEGAHTLAEGAVGLQWEDGPVRIDSAAGVAVPLGGSASPWPEFKVAAWYRPARQARVKLTGGRKGRLPTLRERFEPNGNEALAPEQAWFGEATVELDPIAGLSLSSSAFIRYTSGLIKFDNMPGAEPILVNLDDFTMRGFDIQLSVEPTPRVSAGASWNYVEPVPATRPDGSVPLDFLPPHRASAWLTGRVAEPLGGTLRVRYMDERWDRGDLLPPTTLLDVNAFVALGRGMNANLRIDNLLDNRYEIRSDIRAPGVVIAVSVFGQWE